MKMPLYSFDKVVRYVIPAAEKPTENPLKGWAPWISEEDVNYPVSLIFVRMHWREIEPEEGVYCFEELEKKLHMDFWRTKGVRFILRIVCDTPGRESHMDIPQWLYEKTYGDGTWYDCSYGKGYSPNYSNPVMIEEHRELLHALGEYYAGDLQLGFVELGSLGHWGEWHVNSSAGIPGFPKAEIYNQYVEAYLDVFPSSKLLLRRPVAIAGERGLGLYNDSFGVTSHEEWLSWIANGYVSGQSQEEIAGMPEFWKVAPSGGEFATTYEEAYYVSEGYEETLAYIKNSHTTFLGPRSGAGVEDAELAEAVRNMNAELGYCFRLKEATWTKKVWFPNYLLKLQIENLGVAPFYENWPMLVQIRNEEGQIVFSEEYEVSPEKWLPGESTVKILMKDLTLVTGTYTIEAGMVDPLTGRPGIAFANESVGETEFLYKVMEFTIR